MVVAVVVAVVIIKKEKEQPAVRVGVCADTKIQPPQLSAWSLMLHRRHHKILDARLTRALFNILTSW